MKRLLDHGGAGYLATIILSLAIVFCGLEGLHRGHATAQTSDQLTDVDKLRLENANLFAAVKAFAEEADACRGQLAQPRATANEKLLQTRITAAKAAIEQAHPGFTLDLATGTLSPKPAEKAP